MDLVKTLLMHIRPEAYIEQEKTAASTDFAADIESMIGTSLTPEERTRLGIISDDDVDVIERA
jgi:hypothetical protein